MVGYWVIQPHPAHSFHTDVAPARVTGRAVHHWAPVAEIEVLSFWDAVQLTLVVRWSTSDKAQEQAADTYIWKSK